MRLWVLLSWQFYANVSTSLSSEYSEDQGGPLSSPFCAQLAAHKHSSGEPGVLSLHSGGSMGFLVSALVLGVRDACELLDMGARNRIQVF